MSGSVRLRVLRAFASAAPGLMAAALAFMVAEALLPNLVLIAMGRTVGASRRDHRRARLTGRAPDVAAARLRRGLYAVSLLRGPAEDALGAMVSARMSVDSQRRLVGPCPRRPASPTWRTRRSSTA